MSGLRYALLGKAIRLALAWDIRRRYRRFSPRGVFLLWLLGRADSDVAGWIAWRIVRREAGRRVAQLLPSSRAASAAVVGTAVIGLAVYETRRDARG